MPKPVLTLLYKRSFRVMLNYRIGHYIYDHKFPGSGVVLMYLMSHQLKYLNCHISYAAEIADRLTLPHPAGIVIGEYTIIEGNVTLYQNCTLGQGKDGLYPTIKNGATIYANCVVIGNVTVGRGATIGAHTFVNRSVAAGSVYVRK